MSSVSPYLVSDEDAVINGMKVMVNSDTVTPVLGEAIITPEATPLDGGLGQQSNFQGSSTASGSVSDDLELHLPPFAKTKGWELQRKLNAAREAPCLAAQEILGKHRTIVTILHDFKNTAAELLKARVIAGITDGRWANVLREVATTEVRSAANSGRTTARSARGTSSPRRDPLSRSSAPNPLGVSVTESTEEENEDMKSLDMMWTEDGIRFFILNHPGVLRHWQRVTVNLPDADAGHQVSLDAAHARLTKAASQEVRGRSEALRLPHLESGVHVPLCAMMECFGFVVFAEVDLRLSQDSLSGGTFASIWSQFGTHPETGTSTKPFGTSKMYDWSTKMIGDAMGVRPQPCNGQTAHLTAGVQGHLGADGVFYLRGLDRLTPPLIGSAPSGHGIGTPPLISSSDLRVTELVTRRLRPEFMDKHMPPATQMRCDAWLAMRVGAADPSDLEVLSASGTLYATAIPKLVDLLAMMDLILQRPKEAVGTRMGTPDSRGTTPSTGARGPDATTADGRRQSGQAVKGRFRLPSLTEFPEFDSDDSTPDGMSPTSKFKGRRDKNGKKTKPLGNRTRTKVGFQGVGKEQNQDPSRGSQRKLGDGTFFDSMRLDEIGMSHDTLKAEALKRCQAKQFEFSTFDVTPLFHEMGINMCLIGFVLTELEERLEEHDRKVKSSNSEHHRRSTMNRSMQNIRSPSGMESSLNSDSSLTASPLSSLSAPPSPSRRRNTIKSRRLLDFVSTKEFVKKHPVVAAIRTEMIARATRHVLMSHWRQTALNLAPAAEPAWDSPNHTKADVAKLLNQATLEFMMELSGEGLAHMSGSDEAMWVNKLIPAVASLFEYRHLKFFRFPAGGKSRAKQAVTDSNEAPVIINRLARLPRGEQKKRKSVDDGSVGRPISIAGVDTTNWGAVRDSTFRLDALCEKSTDPDRGPSDAEAAAVMAGEAKLGESTYNPLAQYSVSNDHPTGIPPAVIHPRTKSDVRFDAQQDGDIVKRLCQLSSVELERHAGHHISGFWVTVTPKCKALKTQCPFSPTTMQFMCTGNYSEVDELLAEEMRTHRKAWKRFGNQASDAHANLIHARQVLFNSACGRNNQALECLQRVRQIQQSSLYSELGSLFTLQQQCRLEVLRKRFHEAIEAGNAAASLAEDLFGTTRVLPSALLTLLSAIDASDFNTGALRRRKAELIHRVVKACRTMMLPIGPIVAREAIASKVLKDHTEAQKRKWALEKNAKVKQSSDPLGIAHVGQLRMAIKTVLREQGPRDPETVFFLARYVAFVGSLPMLPTVARAVTMFVPLSSPMYRPIVARLIEFCALWLRERKGSAPLQDWFPASEQLRANWSDAIDPIAAFFNIRDAFQDPVADTVAEPDIDAANWMDEEIRNDSSSFVPADICLHVTPLQQHALVFNCVIFLFKHWLECILKVVPLTVHGKPEEWDVSAMSAFCELVDCAHGVGQECAPLGAMVCSVLTSRLRRIPVAGLDRTPRGSKVDDPGASGVAGGHRDDGSEAVNVMHGNMFTAPFDIAMVEYMIQAVGATGFQSSEAGTLAVPIAVSESQSPARTARRRPSNSSSVGLGLGVGDGPKSSRRTPHLVSAHSSMTIQDSASTASYHPSKMGDASPIIKLDAPTPRMSLSLPVSSPMPGMIDDGARDFTMPLMVVDKNNWKDAFRPMDAFLTAVNGMKVLHDHICNLAAAKELSASKVQKNQLFSFIRRKEAEADRAASSMNPAGNQSNRSLLNSTNRMPSQSVLGGGQSMSGKSFIISARSGASSNTNAHSGGGGGDIADMLDDDEEDEKALKHLDSKTLDLITAVFSMDAALQHFPEGDESLPSLEACLLHHMSRLKEAILPVTAHFVEQGTADHRALRSIMWKHYVGCLMSLYPLEEGLFVPLRDVHDAGRSNGQLDEMLNTLDTLVTTGKERVGAVTGQARYEEVLQMLRDRRDAVHREEAAVMPNTTSRAGRRISFLGEDVVSVGSDDDIGDRRKSHGRPAMLPELARKASSFGTGNFRAVDADDDKAPLHVKELLRAKPIEFVVEPKYIPFGATCTVRWNLPKSHPPVNAWVGVFEVGTPLQRPLAISRFTSLAVKSMNVTLTDFELPHAVGEYTVALFHGIAATAPPVYEWCQARVFVTEATSKESQDMVKRCDERKLANAAEKMKAKPRNIKEVEIENRTWIPFDTNRAAKDRTQGIVKRDQAERKRAAEVKREVDIRSIGRSKTSMENDRRHESPPRRAVTPILDLQSVGDLPEFDGFGNDSYEAFGDGTNSRTMVNGKPSTLPEKQYISYKMKDMNPVVRERQQSKYLRAVNTIVRRNMGVEDVVVVGKHSRSALF